MIRRRISAAHQRYRGPVWKGVAEHAGGLPEAPGRKVGATPGGYIDDFVSLRKSIVLCDACQPKFYYRRAKYYKDEVHGSRVLSSCDGCRDYTQRGRLYMPEERLTDSSGVAQPGQCWSPK
jgi:hypothetical protein